MDVIKNTIRISYMEMDENPEKQQFLFVDPSKDFRLKRETCFCEWTKMQSRMSLQQLIFPVETLQLSLNQSRGNS